MSADGVLAVPEPMVWCRNPADLAAVHRPGVALAVWPRTVPDSLRHFLDRLPAAALPHGRFTVAPRRAAAAVADCVDRACPAPSLGRRLLVTDIAAIIERFGDLTGSWKVAVRLEAVADDSCRKFHADAVPLRLLTTYRGPATQWRPADAGPADAGCADAGPVDAGGAEELPRFAVGLFKGRTYPGQGDAAILHRSPPIQGSGTTRLLLCLDSAE